MKNMELSGAVARDTHHTTYMEKDCLTRTPGIANKRGVYKKEPRVISNVKRKKKHVGCSFDDNIRWNTRPTNLYELAVHLYPQ
jgi:hypothetical protein